MTDQGSVVGSGFLISSDGKVATNLHVIRNLRTGSVKLSSGQDFLGFSVVAFDEEKDLAIIQIAGSALPSVVLGDSDNVQVGEPVLIVGNPLGLQGSVTTGVISAIRDDPFSGKFKTLQTDAAVSPGNSGGPVVNRNTEVIGIIVFRVIGGENLNFAIPVNYLRHLLASAVSPISLDELRTKLVNRPEGASVPKPLVPSTIPEKIQIPSWWFSADLKKVLADPLFPTLSINERTEILTQIDPKFAKMASDKRHAYLWNTETDYLPKAEIPVEVITWNANDRNCSTAFDTDRLIKKTVIAKGIQIEATLDRMPVLFFLQAHLKIINNSDKIVPIIPQIFILQVVKPKRYTLFFEYPKRVSAEIIRSAVFSLGDQLPLIVDEHMVSGSLAPGMSSAGYVWFEQSRAARDVLLRVSIGRLAFDVPFALRSE